MPHLRTLLRLRFAGLGVGVLILLWLPVEDLSPRSALALGMLLSAWLAARACIQQSFHSPLWIWAIGGAAVAPLAAGLVIFKSGLHGHGIPDFTLAQVAAILQQSPWFILGGLLVGAGFRLHRPAPISEE